jgi:Na+-driven multidrug efflux pump
VASAAVGAVGKFNTFAILPALAVNASISAMSAQNLGAGEEKRAVKTMYTGTVIAYAITIIVFLWAQLFPEQVITMFTSESEVIAAGASYLKTYSFDYILVPYMFCMNGLFIGAGHTTFTLISSMLTSIVFRVPSSYIFGIALGWGMRGLGLGAPISAAISLCISLWYFLSGRWRKKIIRPDYEPDRIEAA